MAIAWTDLPLTQQQRDIMLELEAIGAQVKTPERPVPGVVPTNTMTQAKRAMEFMRELNTLTANALKGIQYTMVYHRTQAVQAFEDANP